MDDVPTSFWKFCSRMHQDVFMDIAADENALADFLVRGVAAGERAGLAQFLSDLLARPDASDRLIELFNRSQADFYLKPGGRVDVFFAKIRDKLESV